MKKYCAYLRKSRKDIELENHGELETLKRHEAVLNSLADKMNVSIEKYYKEIVSGENIASRPAVQELLQDVSDGVWDGVFVMEIERLARGDTIDQGIIAQTFKYSNTEIITPSKIFNPLDEFDEEYFEFNLFMSRREYKTITRRIQRGRTQSFKEGKYIASTAPFGYDRVKIKGDKGYTLVPNDDANTVRMIFDLFVTGELSEGGVYRRYGTEEIARILDSRAIKPTNSDTWSRSSIYDILHNITYTGSQRWGRRKDEKKLDDGKIVTKKKVRMSEYHIVENCHEAIIDKAMFEKAQEIFATRANPKVNTGSVMSNPLSGLIYCGKCGKLMTRLGPNSHTKYDSIKCPNRYCDNISSPVFLIEEQVLAALKKWLDEYKLTFEISDDKVFKNNMLNKQLSVVKLKKDLEQNEKQLDNAYDFLEQGIYTPAIFQNRIAIINTRIDDLRSAIDKLENEISSGEDEERARTEIIPKVEHVLSAYSSITDARSKNTMLKEVIERIEYVKTERNKKGKLNVPNFHISIKPLFPTV